MFDRIGGEFIEHHAESEGAETVLSDPRWDGMPLGQFLEDRSYSNSFIEDHLLPMGAAIWSASAREMRQYPLKAFLRFFVNHGLTTIVGRPKWRTVNGGSREYVWRIAADFNGEIRLSSRVASIRRTSSGVSVTDSIGNLDHFDHAVIATHADEALALLDDAGALERELLGAFRYTRNTAVLHTDPRLMPKRKAVWSSWNYIGGKAEHQSQSLCVTYWMNRLQNLDTALPLFVTLNSCRAINPDTVFASFDYAHPLFDQAALDAQQRLWELQGSGNVWFCGAHFGSGFHENGLQAGLAVAEALAGLSRPWQVNNPSSRIFLPQPLQAAE